MRKFVLIVILMLPSALYAQVSNPSVRYVSVAPSGSCAAAPPIQIVISTGDVYTCKNGTWASQAGEATGPGGTNGQIQYNNSGAFGGTSGGTTNGTHFAFGPDTPIDDFGPSILTVEDGSGMPDTTAAGTSALNTAITWNPTSNPLSSNLYMISGVANFDLDASGDAGNDSNVDGINITVNDNGNTISPSGVIGIWTDATTNGTDSPSYVEGVESNIELAAGGSNTTINPAIIGIANNYGFNAVGMAGVIGAVNISGSPTLNVAASFLIGGANITGGTVDDLSGINIVADNVSGATVGVDSAIHIINTETGGATNYAIFSESTNTSSFAGPMDFGDIISPGILTLADGTAHIATAGGDGWQFNCSDCDTPLTEGATCTAAGDHAGTLAIALRGAIKCF